MAADIIIAPPRLRDIPALHRLFRRALLVDFQYFPLGYVDEISHQNNLWRLAAARFRRGRIMVVAKRGDQLIGYALGSLTPEGGGELYWLYVERGERQHRIGSQLLHTAVRLMCSRGATLVTLVTYDLKDYYLHQGFSYRGKQHIHGVDLDVMEYRLDGQDKG
ncbi:MAG TPA: GNAT family N-acetyltransferase [Candidatus Saccharimonadales bacterium]|nr:GNAT family N-acetyltransferase [Candidatus Saccharimonadales bacterium]